MILQGGMFIRNFALLVSVRPLPYFLRKFNSRWRGGGDRCRHALYKKLQFFSPNIVFIKTCWVTVRCAQAMLPKTLFNMLVKRMNFKQYRLKLEELKKWTAPENSNEKELEQYRGGNLTTEARSTESLPWDRGEVEKHVQFAHHL